MLGISICLPYNKIFHGNYWYDFNPRGHYLNEMILDLDEFYNEGDELISRMKAFYENYWVYEAGTDDNYYIEPKIEIVNLYNKGDYSLCILQTYALKIFQRKWKKYYHQKNRFYKNFNNIRMRELTGRFPHFKLK
jgi:hypothetical protein